jgi:predicted regulator of Ras-like GTPase activity (Roadblock/LC7/MglB family)
MTRGVVLSAKVFDELEGQLEYLYEKTGISCVLLIDVSGQLISHKGSVESVDVANLAALIASDMAAVTEMSKLIGESNRVKLRFQEGEQVNLLTCKIRDSFILTSIFNPSVKIGLVRLYTREVATKLAPLVSQFEASQSGVAQVMDADFSSSLADEMERAFSE